MKQTKKIILYLLTVVVIIFAGVWEYYIRQWESFQPEGKEAIVRTDLFVLYPLIITLVVLSLYQIFKKHPSSD